MIKSELEINWGKASRASKILGQRPAHSYKTQNYLLCKFMESIKSLEKRNQQ